MIDVAANLLYLEVMLRRYSILSCLLTILFFSASSRAIWAQKLEANPANYRQVMKRLKPGCTLLLAPGIYRDGLPLRHVHGTKKAPIVIEGVPGKTTFYGRRGHNTVQLTDASFIVIRNLTLDGRGLEVAGIKAGDDTSLGVHHITIEGNVIIGHGSGQMTVGIAAHVPTWNWIIRKNVIRGAGTGLYLGNSDGTCPFIGGIVEYNLVENPIGYAMQIKRQIPRPKIPGIPVTPMTTIIRYNRFVKSDGPSPAGDRPNLLVGGFPKIGPGQKDRYQIYGNVFWHNPREALFQGTGRLSLHDNVFVDGSELGIRVAPHDGFRPKDVRIYHNTFLGVPRALSISGLAKDAGRIVFGNLLLGCDAKGSEKFDMRVRERDIARSIKDDTLAWGQLDVQPKRRFEIKRIPKTWLKVISNDVDHDLDFLRQRKKSWRHAGAIFRDSGKAKPVTK